NARNRARKGERADALTRIKSDESIRAVVITGTGDQAFSAGQDLTEAKDMSGPEAEEWVREFETLYDQVRMLNVPVVAAGNGWAMGAGCQLARLADIRTPSERARGGMPEEPHGRAACVGRAPRCTPARGGRGVFLTAKRCRPPAQRARAPSFRSVSSISTPSPGPSSARIAPSAYCTGRRTTSPASSKGPNSSQPHVTGAAASATWR